MVIHVGPELHIFGSDDQSEIGARQTIGFEHRAEQASSTS